MRLIVKIAWRNIMRHKGKSAVIGVILFIGAFLMTVGNGVVGGMERGLSANIVNGFTGHVVIVSDKQESDNLFIEFMGKAIEPVNNFKQIRAVLDTIGSVKRYLPVGKNVAMLLNEEGGSPGFAYLLGVDYEAYMRMFPGSVVLQEGSMPLAGESAILLPVDARREYFGYTGLWFVPQGARPDTATMGPEARKLWPDRLVVKDQIVFMGMTNDNTATDIRAPVRGVIKYRALNRFWGNFTLIDIESYRRCLGYFAASDMSSSVSGAQKSLLEMDVASLDDLFGSDAAEMEIQQVVETEQVVAEPVSVEDGTYNMVLVLLQDGSTPEQGAQRINAALKSAGVGARAVTWRKATGMIGSMTQIIKGSLFLFVMLLFAVAIIIIVNTLSMAAIERVTEIGMMRAVGARKGFISLMFVGETATLAFVFGGIGVAVGLLVVNVIPLFNITSTNDMVQLLFGGDTFRPSLMLRDIIVVLFQLVIVTAVAVVYPLTIARSITPLDAIARE